MRLITTALLTCMLTSLAALEVGDQAPALDGVDWIKGEAPDYSEQITVVEFWATWCGPCLTSIPHLTELNHEYGDEVAIVGLSKEDRGTIAPFVEEQGEKMDYNVGRSEAGGAYGTFMAGVQGIPHAFVVGKEGTVLWHGHPMAMDDILKQAVAGTLDVERAKRLGEAESKMQQSFRTRDMEQITAAARNVLSIDPAHEQAHYVVHSIAVQEGDLAGYRSFVEEIAPQVEDADTQADLAWLLMGSQDESFRLLDIAVPLAAEAYDAAPEDPKPAAAQARARYLLGDLSGAVAAQEAAAEAKPDDEAIAATLAYYRQAVELAGE